MTEAALALISATALLLGSPGPAPLALAGVGAVSGVKRGIPFLLGILSGLAVAMTGAVIGIAVFFASWPAARLAIQICGTGYICYIAYKVASAPVLEMERDNGAEVPGFADGFVLNLLNPKAYAAFFAVFAQFLLPVKGSLAPYIVTGLACFVVAIVVDVIWLGLGGLIRPIFAKPVQARIVRVAFGISMVAAVLWAFKP